MTVDEMKIDNIIAYAKSKGFFWPSAELYGGASGIFDYGHLGSLLKSRFEREWLRYFVDSRKNCWLIEGSNMLPEKPLIASGHASRFNDVLVGCSKCHTYFRADVLVAENGVKISEGATSDELDSAIKSNGIKCPKCGGVMLPSKSFNMMLDVGLGPEKNEKGYLRPETAQSAYLNFQREFNILRKSLPMGLAIIGRAYRNEISPRQGLYRMRELIQAELQLFFDPENFRFDISEVNDIRFTVVPYSTKKPDQMNAEEIVSKLNIPEFYAYHMGLIANFYMKVLRIPAEKFRFLEKGGDEKAFYNKLHMDIEVDVESWGGFKEVGGLHYRGDYDLSSHSKGSGQDLSVVANGKKFVPNVLELSFGVDRNIFMLIDVFYRQVDDRNILMLPSVLAPVQAAVFALQKDEKLEKKSQEILDSLRRFLKVETDVSGSIGRRYARMDEIGTPLCITVDFNTVDEKSADYNTVTVRKRDDKSQERVQISQLENTLKKYFEVC
jgi:glycyl-tRNA synthetase